MPQPRPPASAGRAARQGPGRRAGKGERGGKGYLILWAKGLNA